MERCLEMLELASSKASTIWQAQSSWPLSSIRMRRRCSSARALVRAVAADKWLLIIKLLGTANGICWGLSFGCVVGVIPLTVFMKGVDLPLHTIRVMHPELVLQRK